MIVTKHKFYMENKLIDRLDLMLERIHREMDNVILIDGDEGMGKSNLEMGIAAYVSEKTGRSFNVDNVFFDLDELIDFASSTKEQIICWDEGALGGMATEWWKKNQMEFIKLLMIARKKKHFVIICIPKFFKLNEYIIVDRSIALLHVYARNEIERGRFVYYSKRKKESLYFDWKKRKSRNYKKFYSFRGTFGKYLAKVLDEDKYEAKKDDAILNFRSDKSKEIPEAVKKKLSMQIEVDILTKVYNGAKKEGISQETIAKWLNISSRTLIKRLNLGKKQNEGESLHD